MITSRALQTRRTPDADAPVLDPAAVAPEYRSRIPRYGDDVWALMALSQNPATAHDRIAWDTFPAALREQFRHAAWALANFPTPTELLVRGPTIRESLSLHGLCKTIFAWRAFANWLDERSVSSLDQVTVGLLTDYSQHLTEADRLTRGTISYRLFTVTRLFIHNQEYLPEDCQFAAPPWFTGAQSDFLPTAGGAGENQTSPITPATMGPLLVWSLRFIEDFAPDILAAINERQRIITRAGQESNRDALPAAISFLEALIASGKPFPATRNQGGLTPALQYLAGRLNLSYTQMANLWRRRPAWARYLQENPGSCPLDLPVIGRLEGRPWTDPIAFHDVRALHRHLVAACFIVVAYLTGMRPSEALAIEAGSCPEPEHPEPSGTLRYQIWARHFKDATDGRGNHIDGGQVRETPWVTVQQVANAIRTLEQLVPTGLLFSADCHNRPRRDRRSNRTLSIYAITRYIEEFINWVDDYTSRTGREHENIPPDPNGPINTARFRRTLAWHIARQPDGLVALAVQYGHLRTIVSEGYASRSKDGIHDLLDFETARATAEHLADLGDDLAGGEGVSGPAAHRLIHAASRCTKRFDGTITTKRQYKALLADPMLAVFENKQAYLTCNYDPAKALCHPDRAVKGAAPSLNRCQAGCANIARTDRHAEGLRTEADRLEAEAAAEITPELIADRLRERAAHLRGLADRHDTDCITTGQDNHQ